MLTNAAFSGKYQSIILTKYIGYILILHSELIAVLIQIMQNTVIEKYNLIKL